MASAIPPELTTGFESQRLAPPTVDERASLKTRGLYDGPAYPFGATPSSVFGSAKDDMAVIATSLVNILSTPKRSMPYDPNIGSEVPYLLFEPLDDITVQQIAYHAARDLADQEPRASVVSVNVDYAEDVNPQAVYVSVGFVVFGDPEEKRYNTAAVFPKLNL